MPQRGVPLAAKRPYVMPVVYMGLGRWPHGIRGPLATTGTPPTGEPSSDRHHGVLRAPRRGAPVDHLLKHLGTGQRAPGGFDAHRPDTAGAVPAHRATPPSGARRIRAGRQPRVAAQRPLMGQAGQVAPCGREGPCDHRTEARDAPRDLCGLLLRCGLVTPQAAQVEELARGKAPLFGSQRQTHTEVRGQRPRGSLPERPVTEQAPTGRGDPTNLG